MYIGSEYEHDMLTEACTFIRQAHELGMITVVWMYPRGQAVSDEKDPQLISGAAGVAACIGADFAKVNYPRAFEGMTSPALELQQKQQEDVELYAREAAPEEFLGRLVDQMQISGCREYSRKKHSPKNTEEAVRMTAACKAYL